MKYLVLSDLHADFNFELYNNVIKDDWSDEEAELTFKKWWDYKKLPQTDGLISAGDISNDYRSFKQFISFISKKYKSVFLTLGNHDMVIKGRYLFKVKPRVQVHRRKDKGLQGLLFKV